MYYLMERVYEDDSAAVNQKSHMDYSFRLGRRLGPEVRGPVIFELDRCVPGRRRTPKMPTMFPQPQLLLRKDFHEALVQAGVDNIDVYPAIVRSRSTGHTDEGYVVANIVGLVSGADLTASEHVPLAGSHVIHGLVLRRGVTTELPMFRLREDRSRILVSDWVVSALDRGRFPDVAFLPVPEAG